MEGGTRVTAGDGVDLVDLGIITDALEETIGDTGGEAGTLSDLGGGLAVETDAEDAGGALDDLDHFVMGIELEPVNVAEAVSERRREGAGTGGGADDGEPGEIEADRLGAGSFAKHDIETEVFHSRV